MSNYNDYETEPIGGGNPYYMCVGCKVSVPAINGRLEGHQSWCPYLAKVKRQEENDWLKFLLSQVLNSLPANRDWLDPDLEKHLRDLA